MRNVIDKVPTDHATKPRVGVVRTEDGTVVAVDAASGLSVSSLTVEEALAELVRLTASRPPGRVPDG